jgi:hypothetical protein
MCKLDWNLEYWERRVSPRHGLVPDRTRSVAAKRLQCHARGSAACRSAKCDPRPAVTDWTNVVQCFTARLQSEFVRFGG